jgi:hypothetical protein
LAAVLAGAIRFSRVPEPSYEGVPLGSLLSGAGGGLQETQQAVRALGVKAVPYLVDVLEHEPTSLQRWYAKAQPQFPAVLQRFTRPPKKFDQRRAWAAAPLTQAGTNAVIALPILIKIAQDDPFFGTRHNAVGTLAATAPGTQYEAEAASAVMSRTTDANRVLCEHAYSCLGKFTNQMQKVVPILLHGLRNPAAKENALMDLRGLGTNAMPIIRESVQNEGYLPMSFDALEVELRRGPG